MVLSIEISDNTAYAAVGKCRKGRVEVVTAGEITLRSGIISEGRILDRMAFQSAVNGYMTTLRRRPKKVVVSIVSKLSLYKELVLPLVSEAELKLMVKNEMLQQISDRIQYKVDYTYIGRKGNMVRVMAYAIPEDIISELKSILKQLRLKPVGLDVNCNCVSRLFSHTIINGMAIDNEPVIIADFGLSSLSCNLFANGHMVIVRNAAVSLQDLERVLAYLGRTVGPADSFSGLDFSPEHLEQDILLYDASKRYLGSAIEELLKIINYRASRNASDPVKRIYLYGAASLVKGLPEYIASTLNVPVDRIESTGRIKIPDGVPLVSAVNSIATILDR